MMNIRSPIGRILGRIEVAQGNDFPRSNGRRRGPAALAALLLLAGCSGIGPGMVSRNRFDYTSAVADSWKSQMLLNLVKIRYGDTPVFLDVASIISQYELEGTFSAAGTLFDSNGVDGVPDSSVGLGAQGRWADRPTITYAPLVGEQFARSMMTPIPPPALLSLMQAGYRADLVFRLTVQAVNGIHNRSGGDLRMRAADPAFYDVAERLRRIQESGAIGMRLQKADEGEATLMTFRHEPDPGTQADVLALRRTLGLDPQAREFRVVYGSVAANDREIAILSRSILQILVELSSFVAVPAEHVAEGRVGPTAQAETGPGGPVPPLIRIASGKDRPDDCFVGVPFRRHWFWIDDRDIPSKRMFTFLMFVFTLVETGGKEGAPIVTIPAG